MRKFKLFTLCILALSSIFVGCKKEETPIDNNPLVEDGFYISGDASAFAKLDVLGQLKSTPNENLALSGARDGLNEIYIALEAGKTFNLTEVAGSTKTVYGPGAGFASVDQAAVPEEMTAKIQKGMYAAGGTFTVPTSGLYHIAIDKISTTIVILPVATWAIIGGATQIGWSDNVMAAKGAFSKDSMVFEVTDITLTTGDFKFRHSGAWKQTVVGDPLVPATAYKINTNFGGKSMEALVTGGANIPFPTADDGKYTVTATWTKAAGMKFKMKKTGTVVVAEYPAKLYIVGSDFGNWGMTTPATAGIVTMIPANGHAWGFWAIVYASAAGEFKFSTSNTAWKSDFGVTGTATNGVYAKGTDNIKITTAGYYMVYADLKALKVSVTIPTVYGIGDTFGGYTKDVPANLFTIDNTAKTITSPPATVSGNLRMYTTCPLAAGDNPLVDWWQMEFNIINGKIEYRGNGGDQALVPITAGQKAVLNFSTGTGVIQ